MAPPRKQGSSRHKGKGLRRDKPGEKHGRRAAGQGSRKGKGRNRPESDPNNEDMYTAVDKFHMQKDKIALDGEDSDSENSVDSEEEEAVMNLEEAESDENSSDDDDSEDDLEVPDIPELPAHVRRAAMAASSDDDSDEDESKAKMTTGWGKKRSSYYDADTADLEIGQEYEDAEAEEEAALELQKASYKGMDAADFGEDDEGREQVEEGDAQGGHKNSKNKADPGAPGVKGSALLTMKNDLEQIALGSHGEVETSVVKRNTSKLSRRDKLELVLSEAPELPALLGEVRSYMSVLTEKVEPLVSNVTEELGASKDGLEYLRTRQQLLLAYCMNVCFYMVLKARGEPAKGHPVVRRLLSLRGLLSSLSPLDAKLEPQMQVLLSALEAGVDLRGSDDGSEDSEDDGDDDDNEDEQGNAESDGDSAAGGTDAARSEDDFDEGNLEEEENMFMGAGNASSEDEIDEGQLSPAAIKKRKKEARKKAKVKARGEAALRKEKGVGALDDFGDEDTDDLPTLDKRGGGDNLLQGMMNRISQRERMSGKRSALQGDLDVPVRERDMTIRVRRPAPGESDDDNSDDLGLGADGLMGGLPPELLQGITHGKKGSKANKRTREEQEEKADAATCDGEDEENAFYASVAKDKQAKKRVKDEKYKPKSRIAGALEAELEAERAARGGGKRGANYAIIKNKGLTPHKNKLNRNPRVKKRNAYQKALTRRKGQVRDMRTGEADAYGGEATGIRTTVTRSRKLKG